jgi:phospholipase C
MHCRFMTLLVAASIIGQARAATTTPIQHVILIMQENRSFDQYFGTFPHATGFPAGVCVPLNPAQPGGGCVQPYHDVHDVQDGGPHKGPDAQNDLDDGITMAKLDGFVWSQTAARAAFCVLNPKILVCQGSADGASRHDVMGYHTGAEIPNYWAYAQHFVLQDHMFAGVRTWSLPAHLDLTSEWVAACTDNTNAATCSTVNDLPTPALNGGPVFPWANLFQLLDHYGVTWKYYLGTGSEPDCEDGAMTCAPQIQTGGVGSPWNPAPLYRSVAAKGTAWVAAHNPSADQFLLDVAGGTLPQVAWVVPADAYSEHPDNGVAAGMEYVTSLVNAVMQSPYWQNTAIFISWDDWGGFYDHVVPPVVDRNTSAAPVQGFGLRVPGLLVSAWARPGLVDHAVLSTASYAALIEQLFAGGAHLNPAKLGIPDSRPDIRDALRAVTYPDGSRHAIGQLMNEFDFSQSPLPPLVLSTHIPTGIAIACRAYPGDTTATCTKPVVKVSWNPVAAGSVPGPFTYHLTRDGRELASCTGIATSCTDQPPRGAHFYRVYAVNGANVASPVSPAAEADLPWAAKGPRD